MLCCGVDESKKNPKMVWSQHQAQWHGLELGNSMEDRKAVLFLDGGAVAAHSAVAKQEIVSALAYRVAW